MGIVVTIMLLHSKHCCGKPNHHQPPKCTLGDKQGVGLAVFIVLLLWKQVVFDPLPDRVTGGSGAG